MANNVTSQVTIECNEAAQVIVDSWQAAIHAMDDDYKMVWKLYDVPAEDVDGLWCIENLGSNWCYSTDIDDNTFSLVSAWDAPQKFVEWMAEKVLAIDENATITLTYEDDSFNFVGYHVWTSVGDRGDTLDFDDLVAMTKVAVPELNESEEGSDEYFDLLYDNICDAAYVWQDSGLTGNGKN
jgi:hypothetical protein